MHAYSYGRAHLKIPHSLTHSFPLVRALSRSHSYALPLVSIENIFACTADGDVNIDASLPTLVVAVVGPSASSAFKFAFSLLLTFAVVALAFVIVICYFCCYSFMIYFCNRFQHMRQIENQNNFGGSNAAAAQLMSN